MRNKLTDELAVCGFNTVKALGEIHPEKINRLFLREERLPLFTRVCKNLAERKRPYKICENEELERICKSPHHQGIVAMIYEPMIEPASPEDLDAWAAGGKTGLLLCDVGNDLNLGAITRAAAFFDASPIVLAGGGPEDEEEDGQPGGRRLSTGAYRTAEGGMEHVEFRSVHSPSAFLRSASRGLVTIGTDPRARLRIRDLPRLVADRGAALSKTGGKPGVILAVGNEETGLSREVKDQCSLLVRIPGIGAIESLNAAQAAALFLQELYDR
ncbi:MAG: RNA methyltransferase [Treponema sp.]|jgi:TrmH RNA methyltransferase|nr:RNA methyltransferase [Treponema sp.]